MPFPDIANDFKLAVNALKSKEYKNNFDDIQNELAGRDVGRIARVYASSDYTDTHDRKGKRRSSMSTLDMLLLNDPEYARLFEEMATLLNEVDASVEQALEQLQEQLEGLQDGLNDMLDNANTLSDGKTKVFKSSDGNFYTDNGELVDPADAAAIIWDDDAPSYEDYLRQKQAIRDTQQRMDDIRIYQTTVIGTARDKMSDPDNPLSKEELEEIKRQMSDHADPLVKKIIEPDTPRETNVVSPDLPTPKL